MADSIRIGLIGANFGARHARVLQGLDGAAVVALADPDPERRRSLAAALSIDGQYESAEELLASGRLDAVVVSSPSYLHERHVGAAFDAGLHVLCDSPVGINGREVSHVVTSAGLVGKVFMWSNPLRFDPRIARGRELVESGQLGEIFQGSGFIHAPDWPHAPDSWRLDRERGGGALLEAGLQSLDALWLAMGKPDPVEAMAASYDQLAKRYAVSLEAVAEDALAGLVRFKNGACLQFSAHISPGRPAGPAADALSIWGSEGTLDLAAGNKRLRSAAEAEPYAEAVDEAVSLRAQAKAFLNAIRGGEEPLSSGKDALALSKMLDALAHSSREKEAVPIKVERNLEDLFGGL